MITTAIISVAAIILTSGLALLHSDAIEESLIPNESAVPETDAGAVDGDTPAEDADEDVTDRDTYNGCITIDIYEHASGNYVSQVIVDSEEAYARLEELVAECYENRTQLFEPHCTSGTSEYWLPESEYRIEVMAGTIFAYSYGVENNTVFESLQSGITFSGGEAIIGYIDSLIADEIAAVKAGTASAPDPKASIVELEKFITYWEGGYNEVLDTYIPGVGRYTPRFPYKDNVNSEGHIDTVIVDVYEHATGKLVGRIDLSSTENFQLVHSLVNEHFDSSKALDPEIVGEEAAVLPEALYRVEIYAYSKGEYGGYNSGLFVAYSYENGAAGDVFELVQIGLAFSGAEEMIKSLDALIADGMAEIAAGNGVIPEEKGCDITKCTRYWEKIGRYSERFPYLAN